MAADPTHPSPAYVVEPEDVSAADVQALLAVHLTLAHGASPPEDVHALDADGLRRPDISLFSIREGGTLLGIGALRRLGEGHAELKSMHTAEPARGRGVGRAMVAHLLDVARAEGCRRVSLETGTMPEFAAARALYASAGFTRCEPFGEYHESSYSVCMTRTL